MMMAGICTEPQMKTLTCRRCGDRFQISAGTLTERRADGWRDEDADCPGCRRQWERGWAEYMEGHHASTTV